jgi:hypothetical protein
MVPAYLKEQYEIPAQKPSMDQFQANFREIISGARTKVEENPILSQQTSNISVFDPEREEVKLRLSRSLSSLFEPFNQMLEALEHVDGEDGFERLMYSPSILDFYPKEMQRVANTQRKLLPTTDPLADLGSDSHYVTKKTENVDSSAGAGGETATITGPTSTVIEPIAATAIEDQSVVAPTTVAKTAVTEGISVAHSPCAYDLSGCVPWACYTTTADSFTPISPMDVRYHRVHICSPNIDKPSMVWTVTGPRPALQLEMPLNGSCPFRTSAQLSLRDKGTYILTESIEQFPLLMHFHGMSGSIYRYWRPKHGSMHADSDQLSSLGKLGQLVKLDSEYIPRAYGGSTIKVDSHCTMLESGLIRAPIFPHSPNPTDFILVRSRVPKTGGQFACTLRTIETLYCMGQSEPLYRVDVPVVPRLHQVLSTRVLVECRRFWLRAKSVPKMDFVSHVFIGERKSLLNRYLADAVRDIQQKPTAGLAPSLSPEEACVINSMKEGIRRLAERGIERIFAISPMRIRNYVRDIEIFERSMPATSRTPRIAHYCVQLENEMRLSSWNLTNDYWDVLTGKRGAMFQFSPIGDPSGGRGEGISFRKILKVDNSSSELVLGDIVGSSRTSATKMENLKTKSKKELVSELIKLNVPERIWRTMSRWQLMRQLALLLGIEDDSEERLAPWKRKALHSERINDAWRKQSKVLADTNTPHVSISEIRRNAEAYGITLEGQDTDETTPPDSGSEDDTSGERQRGLEEMMMDDLLGEDAGVVDEPQSGTEGEEEELALLREIQNGGGKIKSVTSQAPVAAEIVEEKPKITRLQIVSVGRAKSTGNPWSKVTYVYGKKNIALYRKWKELEEEGFPQPGTAGGPSPPSSSWQTKVEMSLKVHRRFQRILKQAAEAGRPIPDVKRCASCHLFGHDSSFEGCPMLVREMNESLISGGAGKKRKAEIDQSPVYD